MKNPYIKKVLVDKYGMNVYTMSGRTKGSIVERFNRTLKERIGIKFEISICKNLFFPCSNFWKKDISRKIGHMIGIQYCKI